MVAGNVLIEDISLKKQYNMKTLTDEKLNESFTFGYSLLGDQIELTLNQKTITLQKVK